MVGLHVLSSESPLRGSAQYVDRTTIAKLGLCIGNARIRDMKILGILLGKAAY
jgi:hypothetical protein